MQIHIRMYSKLHENGFCIIKFNEIINTIKDIDKTINVDDVITNINNVLKILAQKF